MTTTLSAAHPTHRWRFPLALAAVLACAGCAAPSGTPADGGTPPAPPAAAAPAPPPPAVPPPPPPAPAKGLAEQEFELGVKAYEDGDYKTAARHLQAAVNFGLPVASERATAHKYQAFIACASSQPRVCRDEFRRAFAADPAFDLTPAEAGHPIWGPVFRAVKADAAKAKGK